MLSLYNYKSLLSWQLISPLNLLFTTLRQIACIAFCTGLHLYDNVGFQIHIVKKLTPLEVAFIFVYSNDIAIHVLDC